MKTWKKLALLIVPAILILAIGIWRINVSRNQPPVVPPQKQERQLSQDEMVVPRKLFIDSLDSARALVGTPVWIQAGYELDYYPYTAHHVDFAHKSGVLPSIQQLNITNIVTQKVPANVPTRIARGNEQAFAVFTMPGDSREYATAIGTVQGSDTTFYCDNIFYYDDPHQMYKFWPADIWKAIDQHKPKAGMNELQASMALGVMQQSDSSDYGNRTVSYDAGGKHWAVTFENDKAVQIQQPTASS
ncbi:MAG TPA: hypothetical protein VHZ09_01275 [Acidobacteriaceae bacterium]|jgi:hypothetical protein|nr:hypothetical protein [Acidobacteriaceae bacterium]